MALAWQKSSDVGASEGTEAPWTQPGCVEQAAPWGNAAMAEEVAACGGAADAGLPATLPAAIRRHEENRGVVRGLLAEMLGRTRSSEPEPTPSDLGLNTAEWIDRGEVTLFVLSPVDLNSRHHTSAEVAYFDREKALGQGAPTYGDSDRGIAHASANVGAELEGDDLLLYDPLKATPAGLEATLVHEVQHDADEFDGDGAEGRPDRVRGEIEYCPGAFFDCYRTEFRAYWIGAPGATFGSEDDTNVTNVEIAATPSQPGRVQTHTATTRFANRRQQDLFLHMCGPLRADGMWRVGDEWAAGSTYPWLPYYYVLDPAFRAMVDALARPSSTNAIHSVRVEALREAIATGASWRDALTANPLDAQDEAFLADAEASRPFWDDAARLGPEELAALRAAIA